MVILCWIKCTRSSDFRRYWSAQVGILIQRLAGLFRSLPLFLVMIENFTAILLTSIAELSASINRIDTFPKILKQG